MLHAIQERAAMRAVGYCPRWVANAHWPTRAAWRVGLPYGLVVDVYMVTG